MMSGRGWTVNEPGSDQLAPETPELVAYIGNSLRDKGLSDDEIADITGFAPDSNENPFLPTRRHLAAV